MAMLKEMMQNDVTIRECLYGMASFCRRSLYLWAVTTLCYLISRFVSPKYSHLIVFVLAMGYLSYLHIYRMLNDYGGYALDITM